jgi:uncharacterized protein (DUF4415 family)
MKQSKTNWKKVDAIKDEDIDFSDSAEIPMDKFAQAIVRKGLKPIYKKTQITLRIDTEVLAWFKAQGKGYQTNINKFTKSICRSY